jgi:hypothetical protein
MKILILFLVLLTSLYAQRNWGNDKEFKNIPIVRELITEINDLYAYRDSCFIPGCQEFAMNEISKIIEEIDEYYHQYKLEKIREAARKRRDK